VHAIATGQDKARHRLDRSQHVLRSPCSVPVDQENQHPFASVCDQELGLHSFHQETLSNAQWHERFNTKVDVREAIGVTRLHKVLVEHVSQEPHSQDFASLGAAEQQVVRDDAEERCNWHALLRQSGTQQHGDLKVDPQNDFTTGDNHHPKTRQQTLHLLDKHSKTVVSKTNPQSEGASFAQGGGGGDRGGRGGSGELFDKKHWKNREC
jgi:hypothetical protein